MSTDYTLENKIGEGSFGAVYKIKLSTGEIYALKIFDIVKDEGIKTPNEIDILSRSQHVNMLESKRLVLVDRNFIIRSIKGAPPANIQVSPTLGTILPLAIADLHKYIPSYNQFLTFPQRRLIFFQIASAVQYLHIQHLVHMDIKPANILIFDNNLTKLADFGSTAHLGPTNERWFNIPFGPGTIGFIPPENMGIKGNQKITTKFDIWSLGITVLYIYTGKMPKQLGLTNKFNTVNIFSDANRTRNLTNLLGKDNILLIDVLSNMLNISVKWRFDINQIFEHSFFADLSPPPGFGYQPSIIPTKKPRIEQYYGFQLIVRMGLSSGVLTEMIFLVADLYQRLIHTTDDQNMKSIITLVAGIWSLVYRIIQFDFQYKFVSVYYIVDQSISLMRLNKIDIEWVELDEPTFVESQKMITQQVGGIINRIYSLYINYCQHKLVSGFDFLPNVFIYPRIDFIQWGSVECEECKNINCNISQTFSDFFPQTSYAKMVKHDTTLKTIYQKDRDTYGNFQ